jgi:hypothetical protein
MKVLMAAVTAGLLFVSAAAAQPTTTTTTAAPPAPPATAAPSQCPAAPADPTTPDPTSATPQAMMQGQQTYVAWGTQMQQRAECLRGEYNQAVANAQARQGDFRVVAEELNQVTQSWTAAQTTFCARPRMSCPAANAGHH